MIYKNTLYIYTDGSSFSGPRRGGIGIVFVWLGDSGEDIVEDHPQPGHEQATNNQMELLACIRGLRIAEEHKQLSEAQRVIVSTDSMYVTRNVWKARQEWAPKKWFNRHGRPIENAGLWKDLLKAIARVRKRVEFKWVKGHSKDVYNKRADKLARASATGALVGTLGVATVRRKLTSRSVEIGCVPMEGQSLAIRIISATYLKKPQEIHKYKYEVLPNTGEHADKVDLIYSKRSLKAGHHYEVRVNDDPKNPRIIEVVRELEKTSARPVPSASPDLALKEGVTGTQENDGRSVLSEPLRNPGAEVASSPELKEP